MQIFCKTAFLMVLLAFFAIQSSIFSSTASANDTSAFPVLIAQADVEETEANCQPFEKPQPSVEGTYLGYDVADYCFMEFKLDDGRTVTYGCGFDPDERKLKSGERVRLTMSFVQYWETDGGCFKQMFATDFEKIK
jgi:hypothetical protein